MNSNNNVSYKQKYIWNMVGSLCTSLMSVVLLFFVNRINGEEHGGIFSFAYSHAQLMYTIGVFEVRPLQSTDISEKYKFNTYYSLRILTCIGMMAISVGYIFFENLTGIHAWVVMILCVYQTIEAFTDTFSALFQQKDRIDYSGKTATYRACLSMFTFVVTLILTGNLVWACCIMCISSMAVFLFYDLRVWPLFNQVKIQFAFGSVHKLAVAALPLFASRFIMIYISNAPKYAINQYCSNVIQNKYNILFMPAFVINLFSTFAFRPMLVDITKDWDNGNIKKFVSYIVKIFLLISGVTILGGIGAYWFGIPLLSIVYGVDLDEYKMVLLLVMIYGGLNALTTFLYYVITVTRRQVWLILGYAVAMVIIIPLAPFLVQRYEMFGAAFSTVCVMLILNVVLAAILGVTILMKRKRIND